MKQFVFSAVAVLAITVSAFRFNEVNAPTPAQINGKWVVDKSHSNVKFSVAHLVVTDMEGSFKNFDGTLETTKDDLSDAKINFTVDVNSINTDNEARDKHLKGDDFFNAEQFPQMKFESTSIKAVGKNKFKLNGNLTIRDVTRPVSFDLSYGGVTTMWGKTKAGFKATATIDRFDYKLKWSKATEAGGLVVGKDVAITLNVEMEKI